MLERITPGIDKFYVACGKNGHAHGNQRTGEQNHHGI